jgi:hypothetical protein
MIERTIATERDVTDEEVVFYEEHGWVMLRQLASPEVTRELLARLQRLMGTDAEQFEGVHDRVGSTNRGVFADYNHGAKADDYLRDFTLSKQAGRNVQRLFRREVPIRYWNDLGACKLPAVDDAEMVPQGTTVYGIPAAPPVEKRGRFNTPWHQDYDFPGDRFGTLTIWLALVDMPPEMGTMRFLSGVHHEGPLGRVSGDGIFEQYPYLRRKYEVSEPLTYRAGDATVHHPWMLHSAPANRTDRPRWAYIRQYFAGDAVYTGMPCRWTDDLGLEVGKRLEHAEFPVVVE